MDAGVPSTRFAVASTGLVSTSIAGIDAAPVFFAKADVVACIGGPFDANSDHPHSARSGTRGTATGMLHWGEGRDQIGVTGICT